MTACRGAGCTWCGDIGKRKTTRVDKHGLLIDAGWRSWLDGLWRSPDPGDLRAFTTEPAWHEHESTNLPPRPEAAST